MWDLKAQKEYRMEHGRYKSILKAGEVNIKATIMGDAAVGKTTLIITYTTGVPITEDMADIYPNVF